MTQKVNQIPLQSNEMFTERPFTHTNHIPHDREIMDYMAKQVCVVLETHFDSLREGRSIVINEPDGRPHRYFIPRPRELLQAKKVFVVGFFGQKRTGRSVEYFGALDEQLVEVISTLNEILSYSTMVLPDGGCSNLVLLLDEDIKSKWMEGDVHRKAVDLSPGYYQSIRINNGIFPSGIFATHSLRITRVKYYDYQQDPPWKAVRELDQ